MAFSNELKTVIDQPYSGDFRIDVLINGLQARWGPTIPAGTARQVTYSFASNPGYLATDPVASKMAEGFAPFSESQKTAARSIFALISERVKLDFVEVVETAAANSPVGMIRFSNAPMDAETLGSAYMPDTGARYEGDVFINASSASQSFLPGSVEYDTLLHEIAHAIGLDHPANYDGEKSNFLATAEDSKTLSVTSYEETPEMLQRVDLGVYDLLALDYLYGLRTVAAGSDTYVYTDADGAQMRTLVDNGGRDTLDLRAVTTGVSIDLNGGKSSSFGKFDGKASVANLQIAFATDIEAVLGSAQADKIIGSGVANSLSGGAGDDTFTGGGGNDVLEGGAGTDTAVYTAGLSQYALRGTGSAFTVQDNTVNREGVDALSEIERLQFADMTVNLTTRTVAQSLGIATANRAIELYLAFFNRVPDGDGLGYWLSAIRDGMTINQVADSFYQAGVYFGDLTGYRSNMSDGDFVNVVYRNVLGRKEGADPDGLAYWSGELAGGRATRGKLVTTMLDSAHSFKGHATWGWVADLLDNKIAVGRSFGVDMGLGYLSPSDSITKGMAIAAAITATDTSAAIKLVGVTDVIFG